jgi:hypothetical protein
MRAFWVIVVVGIGVVLLIGLQVRNPFVVFESDGFRQSNYGAWNGTLWTDHDQVPGLDISAEVNRELSLSAPFPTSWKSAQPGATKRTDSHRVQWSAYGRVKGNITAFLDHYKSRLKAPSRLSGPGGHETLSGIDTLGRSLSVLANTNPDGSYDVSISVDSPTRN